MPLEPVDCVVRPKDQIELSSDEDGVLTSIEVERGQIIRRAQIVARLDSRLQNGSLELARIRAEDESALRAAEARLKFRRDEMKRVSELHQKHVVSAATRDEARVELELAKRDIEGVAAQMKLAAAELRQAEIVLDRRIIRSPVDGVVLRVTASPGEYANEQAPVMTIVELDPLYVDANLPIGFFPALALGQSAEVRIGAPFNLSSVATVSAIDSVFDAASGTFAVRLRLPNPDLRLPSGVKCKLALRPATQ